MFKHFDTDDSNVISKENIKEALANLGRDISTEELDKVMKEHDIYKDGSINFDEFKAMLLDNF